MVTRSFRCLLTLAITRALPIKAVTMILIIMKPLMTVRVTFFDSVTFRVPWRSEKFLRAREKLMLNVGSLTSLSGSSLTSIPDRKLRYHIKYLFTEVHRQIRRCRHDGDLSISSLNQVDRCMAHRSVADDLLFQIRMSNNHDSSSPVITIAFHDN